MNEITQHKIKIYEFPPGGEEDEDGGSVGSAQHKSASGKLRARVPFAVVGSNTVIEQDGKKIRGRKYPWGIAEGENTYKIFKSIQCFPLCFVNS